MSHQGISPAGPALTNVCSACLAGQNRDWDRSRRAIQAEETRLPDGWSIDRSDPVDSLAAEFAKMRSYSALNALAVAATLRQSRREWPQRFSSQPLYEWFADGMLASGRPPDKVELWEEYYNFPIIGARLRKRQVPCWVLANCVNYSKGLAQNVKDVFVAKDGSAWPNGRCSYPGPNGRVWADHSPPEADGLVFWTMARRLASGS